MTTNAGAGALPPEGDCNYVPYAYLHGFLRFLDRNRDRIDVLTFDDLDFGDDVDHERSYPEELRRWRDGLASGRWDRNKVHVFLQHDVDRYPERTARAVRDEIAVGLRANVMVFNRRTDRRSLQEHGRVVERDYDLDVDLLREAETRHGFVIGYHTNAYERAGFDRAGTADVFRDDVAALRQHFALRFFSPHGGARDPEGLSNASIDLPDDLRGDIRWVHNRYTIRFDGQYSDGALNAVRRDPNERDLRTFVRTWMPGRRYRVLIHPQYYHDPSIRSPKLDRAEWYVALCDAAVDAAYDPWADVDIAAATAAAGQ